MPTATERNLHLLERLSRYPVLSARIESLLGVVENVAGDVVKADAAERRVIEELRQMGNEVLTAWADQSVEKAVKELPTASERRLAGKKTLLAYDLR